MREGQPRRNRGIAPTIGAILLAAIVVVFGVVVGGIFLGFTEHLKEPAPLFVSDGGRIDVGVDNGTIDSQAIVLTHRGGQRIDTSNIEVVLDSGTKTTRIHPGDSGDVNDGVWSVGETMPIPINYTDICNGSGRLDVRLVHTRDSSYVVGEKSIPIVEGGFSIQDGSIVPASEYTAEAKVLGAGFTYGSGGPNIDIRLDVVIGSTSHDPWPGNINNNGNPRSHTFSNQPAGAAIKVGATADQNGIYISPRTRWSNASTGWVYVLRDGDTPPNIGAFGDQTSAASYVSPYLDADGKIDISDNQAIVLYELGNSQSGSAADFQDVVVLVSLQTQQTTVVQQYNKGEQVLICPDS